MVGEMEIGDASRLCFVFRDKVKEDVVGGNVMCLCFVLKIHSFTVGGRGGVFVFQNLGIELESKNRTVRRFVGSHNSSSSLPDTSKPCRNLQIEPVRQ